MRISGLFLFLSLIIMTLLGCSSLTIPPTNSVKHQEHNVVVSKKIWIDKSFSDQELNLIKTAFLNWETATYGIINFDLIFDFDVASADTKELFNRTILRKASKNDDIITTLEARIKNEMEEEDEDYSIDSGANSTTTEERSPIIYGFFMKRSNLEHILLVADRMYDQSGSLREKFFLHVAAHEIAHSIGLQHYDELPAIMNTGNFSNLLRFMMQRSVEPPTYPTAADLMQFCHVYFCNPQIRLK